MIMMRNVSTDKQWYCGADEEGVREGTRNGRQKEEIEWISKMMKL